jgi:hypothetical protein
MLTQVFFCECKLHIHFFVTFPIGSAGHSTLALIKGANVSS